MSKTKSKIHRYLELFKKIHFVNQKLQVGKGFQLSFSQDFSGALLLLKIDSKFFI